jgi:hypothetical protein
MVKKNIYFLGGMPRTGSTLLLSILAQNPDIHTDSDAQSAVCQLVWDMHYSCYTNSSEQLTGSGKTGLIEKLVGQIPITYYFQINKPIIIDKCREWSSPVNVDMITKYINPKFKMIITDRNLTDIVKSYIYIRKMNNHKNPEEGILDENSEPIMRAFRSVQWAKNNNNGQFIFIDYDELIENTAEVISKIYEFCEWKPFDHQFENIINPYKNRDEIYGLIGLHDVRNKIKKRDLNIKLSAKTITRIKQLESS